MTQLDELLFKLSFSDIKKVRIYMLKKYNVYCGSMKTLEQAIYAHISNDEILCELLDNAINC